MNGKAFLVEKLKISESLQKKSQLTEKKTNKKVGLGNKISKLCELFKYGYLADLPFCFELYHKVSTLLKHCDILA